MNRSRRRKSVVTERTTRAHQRQAAGRLEVPPADRPPVRPNRSNSTLLDTMGVDIKICHELVRQCKASLDKAEMRQTYRAGAVPGTMMDRSPRGQSAVTERTTQAWTRARQGAGRLEVPPADRPPVRPNPSTSALLDTMGVDIKICKEQLRQCKASLDKVEQPHGAGSVPDLPEFPQAVGPPSTHYRLFRDVPEDCEWARNLERQLRTGMFELMPEEELDALMSYLIDGPSQFQSAVGPPEGPTMYESAVGPPEGPSQFQSAVGTPEGPTMYQSEGQSQNQSAVGLPESPSQYQSVGLHESPSQYQSVGPPESPSQYQSVGPPESPSQYQSVGPPESPSQYQSVDPHESPSQYQSAVVPPEGPTLYESALDLFPSNKSQDLGLSRAGQMETDYSDYTQAGGARVSSEEVLRGPPHPSHALLELEVGELSSITLSTPQPHRIFREFFNRKLAPCNSTPRNSGVQGVSESRGSADGPRSLGTAVVEPAQLSFQPSEEEDSDGDEDEGGKETRWAPEFEPEVVVEAEFEETSEEDSEEEVEEAPAAKMEGTAEAEEDGEEELEAVGEVLGTAGFCEGGEEDEEEGDSEGSAEEFSGGDEERESEGSAAEFSGGGDEEDEDEDGESEGSAAEFSDEKDEEGKSEGTAAEFSGGGDEEDEDEDGESEGSAAEFSDEKDEEGKSEGTAAEFSGGDEEGNSEGSAEEEEEEFGDEEDAEDAANPKDKELSLDVQLFPRYMDNLRAHSGAGHLPRDVTEEKDAAAGHKGASGAENRETQCSGDSRPPAPPPEREENRGAPYGPDEPRLASPREAELLSHSLRAHSTLDEILEAQTLD